MNKKYFIIGLLCLWGLTSQAQLEKNNFWFMFEANTIQYKNYKKLWSAGIEMQLFIAPRVSLVSRFTVGPDMAHLPLAAMELRDLFWMRALSSNDEDQYWWFIFVTEGVCFHLIEGDNFSFSPYVNPLGYEYINERKVFKFYNPDSPSSGWYVTGAVGAKFNFIIDHWVIAPAIEYKHLYGTPSGGVGMSLGVGWWL